MGRSGETIPLAVCAALARAGLVYPWTRVHIDIGQIAANPSGGDLHSEHLSRLLELYKHQYGLFVKVYLFYLAIVSALVTLLYDLVKPLSPIEQSVACLIGIVVSGLSVASCYLGHRWSGQIELQAARQAEGLGLSPVPLADSNRLTLVLMILSGLVGLFFLIKLLISSFANT